MASAPLWSRMLPGHQETLADPQRRNEDAQVDGGLDCVTNEDQKQLGVAPIEKKMQETRSQEQPSDLNLGAADPEDDRRTKKRWMDAITEDMCVDLAPEDTREQSKR